MTDAMKYSETKWAQEAGKGEGLNRNLGRQFRGQKSGAVGWIQRTRQQRQRTRQQRYQNSIWRAFDSTPEEQHGLDTDLHQTMATARYHQYMMDPSNKPGHEYRKDFTDRQALRMLSPDEEHAEDMRQRGFR